MSIKETLDGLSEKIAKIRSGELVPKLETEVLDHVTIVSFTLEPNNISLDKNIPIEVLNHETN